MIQRASATPERHGNEVLQRLTRGLFSTFAGAATALFAGTGHLLIQRKTFKHNTCHIRDKTRKGGT